MLRAILERASRRVVVRRKLPAAFGHARLYVSPGARLGYWGRLDRADADLLSWAQEFVQLGMTVWDVGANVGVFTFAAAASAGTTGRVVAVEADTWLVDLLRRSAREFRAGAAPVDVVPAAVGASLGIVEFHVAARSRASSHIGSVRGSTQAGGVRERQAVPCVPLDWLAGQLPPPDLLKIDVEGSELLVLEGASRLLSEQRPTILCEVTNENAKSVATLFREHAYDLFDLNHPHPRTRQDTPAFNTLALPR